MKKHLTLLILTSLLVLTACGTSTATPSAETPPPPSGGEFAVVADAHILPRASVDLAFSMGGRVTEVLVLEGAQVEAGQVLARVDDTTLRTALTQAKAGLTIAQAQLARAKLGARPEEVDAAEAALAAAEKSAEQAKSQSDLAAAGPRKPQVTMAEAELVQAQAQLRFAEAVHDASSTGPGEWQARLQRDIAAAGVTAAQARLDLVKLGTPSQERAAAVAAAAAARAHADQATAQLALVRAGARAEDIAVYVAQVTQAEAQVAAAQAALVNTELRAPFAGRIASAQIHVGEYAAPGVPLFVLADFSSWTAETENLTEIEIVRVAVGQKVTLILDALPDQTLQGEVTAIKPLFEEKRGDITYAVTLVVQNPPASLQWGMTAEVTFGQ